MFDAIVVNHGVTGEQIRLARGERNAVYDAAVGLLFVPVYVFVVSIACRSLLRRFSADARPVQWIARVVASVCISVLGLQAFRLWGAIWEAIRVGNGHMSGMRLAPPNRWPHQYPGADFIAGVLLFWLVAVWYSRTTAYEEAPRASDLTSR